MPGVVRQRAAPAGSAPPRAISGMKAEPHQPVAVLLAVQLGDRARRARRAAGRRRSRPRPPSGPSATCFDRRARRRCRPCRHRGSKRRRASAGIAGAGWSIGRDANGVSRPRQRPTRSPFGTRAADTGRACIVANCSAVPQYRMSAQPGARSRSGHDIEFLIGIAGHCRDPAHRLVLSSNRRAIRLRVVGAAFALQAGIAVLVLYVPAGKRRSRGCRSGVVGLLGYADAGTKFLFGPLATDPRRHQLRDRRAAGDHLLRRAGLDPLLSRHHAADHPLDRRRDREGHRRVAGRIACARRRTSSSARANRRW